MPSPIHLTVANGAAVSSSFIIERADRAIAIAVPSHAAIGWFVAFAAQVSGAAFLRLGSHTGMWSSVFSGSGGAWTVVEPATGFARIETSGNVSATMSVMVVPVLR